VTRPKKGTYDGHAGRPPGSADRDPEGSPASDTSDVPCLERLLRHQLLVKAPLPLGVRTLGLNGRGDVEFGYR